MALIGYSHGSMKICFSFPDKETLKKFRDEFRNAFEQFSKQYERVEKLFLLGKCPVQYIGNYTEYPLIKVTDSKTPAYQYTIKYTTQFFRGEYEKHKQEVSALVGKVLADFPKIRFRLEKEWSC